MPTLFKMSDEKQTTETPAAFVISATQEPRAKKTKKYAIIAVSAILGAAVILTAILVGMYMFTEAQKEIIQYSLKFNQDSKQDVVSDPNTNIVQYHVTQDGHESWIVNDFNKDIQVVKIQTDQNTVCYMNALNRSLAMDPSQITKPTSTDMSENAGSQALVYKTSNTPVSDTSFLPKAARDMCKGISVYWVYPHCAGKTAGAPPNGTDVTPRNKRQTITYVTVTYEKLNGYNLGCVAMCCRKVCACGLYYTCTVYKTGQVTCAWYLAACSGPIYDWCTSGPNAYRCPNRIPTQTPTC